MSLTLSMGKYGWMSYWLRELKKASFREERELADMKDKNWEE